MAARAAIGLDSKTLPQLRKKEQSLPQIVDHTRKAGRRQTGRADKGSRVDRERMRKGERGKHPEFTPETILRQAQDM
jgi:hypothetical protein